MKTSILSLAAAFLFVVSTFASETPPASHDMATKLVSAIASDDHAAFVVDGNAAFQALNKEDQFESVVSQLGSK